MRKKKKYKIKPVSEEILAVISKLPDEVILPQLQKSPLSNCHLPGKAQNLFAVLGAQLSISYPPVSFLMFKAVCSSQPVCGSVPRTLREQQRSCIHLHRLLLPPAAARSPRLHKWTRQRSCLPCADSASPLPQLPAALTLLQNQIRTFQGSVSGPRSPSSPSPPAPFSAPPAQADPRPGEQQRAGGRRPVAAPGSPRKHGAGGCRAPGRPPCLPCTCLSSRSYSQVSAGPGRPLPSPVYSQFLGRLRSQPGSASAFRIYCLEQGRPTPRHRGPRHPRGCLQRMGF